ncbi:MAG: VOC family protein [Clostridium sp.]|nr:VOC family protein [Clostridium sp.]
MRIEHIAMYVNDLEKEKEFFEIYFGAKAGNKYVHEEIGFSSYFLEFQDGARLELMHRVEMDDIEKRRNRTGFIHIAFTVGGKEDVDRITEIIKNDGYEVISGPRTTGDGYYESCILDPEENQIEITAATHLE